MRNITPAYVAGLVDGEGCITIEASKRFYYPRIYIGMSAKALPALAAIHDCYGGTLRQHRQQTLRWSAAYMLTFSGVDTVPLLTDIGPHLILKIEQCDLALQLASAIKQRKTLGVEMWDQAFTEIAQALAGQMRLLNRKGPTE